MIEPVIMLLHLLSCYGDSVLLDVCFVDNNMFFVDSLVESFVSIGTFSIIRVEFLIVCPENAVCGILLLIRNNKSCFVVLVHSIIL